MTLTRMIPIRALWLCGMLAAQPLLALPLAAQTQAGGGMLTASFGADGRFRPILIQTEGAGPAQRIAAFTVNPEIYTPEAARARFAADPTMRAIREGFEAHRDARADALFRDAAWTEFSFAFDVAGEVLGQAENIGQLSLSNINDAMTELGLFMTIWQVSLDLANDDDRAAGSSAFRGMMAYARGKFGWPALNLFSPAIFIIDHALTSFGERAWLARTDAWRQAYVAYYREYDETAAAAARGWLGGRLDLSDAEVEERVRAIRARTEGGRTRDEWLLLLYRAQQRASSPERFLAVVETELRNYVQIFWDSPQFELYSRDIQTGSGTWGFARGASLTDEIRRTLEDEHTAALMALFIREIFPRITHRNWIDATEAEVDRLNADLRPALNAPLEIVVSALDIAAPTPFEIPLPDGDGWRGLLQPGEDRVLRVTKFAWLGHGAPDRITLLRPEGVEEQPIAFDLPDRAVVQFGHPATGLIAVYRVEEADERCDHVYPPPSTRPPDTTHRAAPRSPWTLSYAVSPAGSVTIGDYDPAHGWRRAATGRPDAAGLVFAEPYFFHIASLSGCTGGFLEGRALADASCRLTRSHFDVELIVPAHTTCVSTAELSLIGAHVLSGETVQSHDFTGPAGAAIREAIIGALGQMGGAVGSGAR